MRSRMAPDMLAGSVTITANWIKSCTELPTARIRCRVHSVEHWLQLPPSPHLSAIMLNWDLDLRHIRTNCIHNIAWMKVEYGTSGPTYFQRPMHHTPQKHTLSIIIHLHIHTNVHTHTRHTHTVMRWQQSKGRNRDAFDPPPTPKNEKWIKSAGGGGSGQNWYSTISSPWNFRGLNLIGWLTSNDGW